MNIIEGHPGSDTYKITCYADPTKLSRQLGLSVTAVTQFRTRYTQTRDRTLPHEHLLFCQSGSGTLETGGQAYEVTPNTLYYLPANRPHSYEQGPDGWWVWSLHFTGDRAGEFLALLELSAQRPVLRIHQTAEVLRLWTEIIQLLQHRPTGCLALASTVAQQLLVQLRMASHGSQDERIRFLAMVDMDSQNLDKIALAHGMSKGHFIRRFRTVVGVTPWQYILRLRIDRAKAMLADPELGIAAVAEAVGFDDANYFSRVFSQHVGVPPSRFRRTLQS